MSVQGDERLATAAGIETRKFQTVMFEAESQHDAFLKANRDRPPNTMNDTTNSAVYPDLILMS
jgi:hypothetical protein